MNKNYQKGYNFEQRVKKVLEKKGFYVVRSAGSHTLADLIALKENVTLIVQCKNKKRFNPNRLISSLMDKEERDEATYVINNFKIPVILIFNDNHKIGWVSYGGFEIAKMTELLK